MPSAISSSQTGLHAAQTWLDSNAHNIANAATDKFTRQNTSFREQSSGGVQAQVEKTQQPMTLETEMVEMLQAKNLYTANARMLKTSNDVLGTLFDSKA